jgi:hypothetical protein
MVIPIKQEISTIGSLERKMHFQNRARNIAGHTTTYRKSLSSLRWKSIYKKIYSVDIRTHMKQNKDNIPIKKITLSY